MAFVTLGSARVSRTLGTFPTVPSPDWSAGYTAGLNDAWTARFRRRRPTTAPPTTPDGHTRDTPSPRVDPAPDGRSPDWVDGWRDGQTAARPRHLTLSARDMTVPDWAAAARRR